MSARDKVQSLLAGRPEFATAHPYDLRVLATEILDLIDMEGCNACEGCICCEHECAEPETVCCEHCIHELAEKHPR